MLCLPYLFSFAINITRLGKIGNVAINNYKYTKIQEPKTKNITLWNPQHEET